MNEAKTIGAAGHWRQRWITGPLLRLFRRITPSMSQTEREALEAGTVWWDGELFRGRPDWQKLRTLPTPELTDEEQAFLNGPVETLCAMLDDWDITHRRHDLAPEAWDYIKEHGFFGMIIPRRYGGLEFSALAHSEVVLKVASRSTTAAVTVMVPNSLGPAKLLLEYGTEAQKDHYLPRLANGTEVPCFALTGPEAGSDAGAMPDSGVVCRQSFDGQEDVLGIRLNWDKRYITLGPVATVLGLAFKLYDPDHLLGDQEKLGITLALIPTDTPGVTIGRRHMPLNIPFMNGPTQGRDVFIPLDWVIGGPERVGQGWRMLMECLSDGRSISLPALATAGGKLATRLTGGYARIRRQFRLPIGRFEGVQEALARIGGYTYTMDAARVLTVGALDRGEKPSVISAIVKYHLTEHMRRVINDAMDVLGGKGISLGPTNLIGRTYQALPISITVEGANILTRSMIIFGQGAMRSHPYVLREMEAAQDSDPQRSLDAFDEALVSHVGFTLSNTWRALWLGLTGAIFSPAPGRGPARRYYQKLTRMSTAFALLADTALMVLGGGLKRREGLSARLGDILSQLYLASAALKRFESQGRPKEDEVLLRWACDQALHEIQERIDGLLRNLPNRPVAWIVRWLVFPLGRHFAPPSDHLSHRVAELLLTPSEARDRLTAGLYMPEDLNEPFAVLEDALEKVIAAEPFERRLREELHDKVARDASLEELIAAGREHDVLTDEEADRINAASEARRVVIAVDDFPPDFGKGA
ncbi:MAG: acyl-CoA dehydrogenase [Gammaproteobacteria bacterium]